MIRQACCALVAAIAGGTFTALTGGSLHDAVSYGIALLTGAFIGLGLARW